MTGAYGEGSSRAVPSSVRAELAKLDEKICTHPLLVPALTGEIRNNPCTLDRRHNTSEDDRATDREIISPLLLR